MKGDMYLVKMPELQHGPKCDHKSAPGRWLVEKPDGKLYCFDPPTQLQKDIWLSAVKRTKDHDERIRMLRWFCNECGTVQEP